MRTRLQVRAIPVPREDAEHRMRRACALLAEGLAELFIADARAEVAGELGVDADGLDREGARVTRQEVDRLSANPGLLRGAR